MHTVGQWLFDKGLVLYDSLCKNVGDFRLYVEAFDETCRLVLSQYENERLVVISLAEFNRKNC